MAQTNPLEEYSLLIARLGELPAAKELVRRVHDAPFDKRMGLAVFIATGLGHELELREEAGPIDPDNPPPLDDVCLICRRRVFVPFDRPGIEGSAFESTCSSEAGSAARN